MAGAEEDSLSLIQFESEHQTAEQQQSSKNATKLHNFSGFVEKKIER